MIKKKMISRKSSEKKEFVNKFSDTFFCCCRHWLFIEMFYQILTIVEYTKIASTFVICWSSNYFRFFSTR